MNGLRSWPATARGLAMLGLAGALAACAAPGVGEFKGCAKSSVRSGDQLKANGQDVVVQSVVGPSSNCTVDRPIEVHVRAGTS